MKSDSVLSHYQSIALLTGEMVVAARANDWDALLEKEARCAEIIARIQAAGGEAPLSTQEREQRARLITQMLADDAEVRDLLNPCMARLSTLLQGRAKFARANRAYLGAKG
jgi:flagellar protein FliT